MSDPALRRLLRTVAVNGYGYPDHVLVWREVLPGHVIDEVAAWARRERHELVELLGPDDVEPRAYWLVPRGALEEA